MSVQIFVPGVGQFENIGDIILRRQLLSRLREFGTLHIYVGPSTDDYDEALGVTKGDSVYRSFSRWYWSAIRAAASGHGTYVFKPGEIQLSLLGMKEHLSMLPVAALARARHQPVIRIGSGSRNFAAIPRLLIWPSVKLSSLVRWRDTRTAQYLHGELMPDLAFGEGATGDAIAGRQNRDSLVVSMRSDRAETPQNWIDAVKEFAEAKKLRIYAVSQVIRDNPKTTELARRLGGEAITWDGVDHAGQESLLRSLYARTEIAISDRLHVLIAAFTEGALPAAILTDGSDKVARHFASAGIAAIDFNLDSHTRPTEVTTWLSGIVERRGELMGALEAARVKIDEVFQLVRGLFTPARVDRKRRAYHVGRSGEVAGGMTQVMNSYKSWEFPHFQISVIESRGQYPPLRAVRVFLSAVWKVIVARDAKRSVLVVHLSQGGSFVREGWILRIGRRRGYATVAQIHGSSFVEFSRDKPKLVRRVLRAAHCVHVLSTESANAVREMVPGAIVRVIPNAVEDGKERLKEKTVVFAGAIGRRKGVDLLARAWSPGFAEAGWSLALAGPVREGDVLPSPLPSSVKSLGALPHGELMELLETSQVAVLPSRDEAMPMFLIEAMARGNAIVSTTVGGIPTLVGEDSGILVPAGDAESLGSALARVLTDDEFRESAGRAARESYRLKFSPKVVIPQLEDLWLEAVGRAAR